MSEVYESENRELFKVVSLFAGCGGSSTGYRLAGGKVLAINEFIPKACEAYHANYPKTHIFSGDVRQLTGKMILDQIGMVVGELDLLDGSPPCASFSMAGNREEGWGREKKYSDTTQRTDDLFLEYARIVKEIQPKMFVAENVKGLTIGVANELLGSEQMGLFGEHENTFFHTLSNCGYKVKFKVLNASHYGVPQARERLFIVGLRNDFDIPITFPEPFPYRVTSLEALEGVVNSPKDIENSTHSEGVVLGYVKQLKEGESGDQYAPSGYFGLQRIERGKPCPTICQRQGNKGACLLHWSENRELTIPELKRLHSLPDDFILNGSYKQNCERIGRSVPPLLMKALIDHLYKTILSKIV